MRTLGTRSLSLLIVASMVGTGVFTTSGYMLELLHTPERVLAVWALGGLVAFAGAWSYADLMITHPESGGELLLLTRAVHPFAGFLAGVVSLIGGFAAPIAASAIAFARYAQMAWPGVPLRETAIAVILFSALPHITTPTFGRRAQDAATWLKLVLIAVFLAAGMWAIGDVPQAAPRTPETPARAYAQSLLLVYYAYTGWNAASYVAGQVKSPERTIPRSLALSMGAVTLLYLACNAILLWAVPASELSGRLEVAHLAALHLLGSSAAKVLSAGIALGLLSTIGALVLSGAQVIEAFGRLHPPLDVLAQRTSAGAPIIGILVQVVLGVGLVVTSTFDLLLSSVGFLLSLSAVATVVASGRRMWRQPSPAGGRSARLVLPTVFCVVSAWAAVDSALESRGLIGIGVGCLLLAGLGYAVLHRNTLRITRAS
jgi:basic amino acid/polyamine antiporter, APA family